MSSSIALVLFASMFQQPQAGGLASSAGAIQAAPHSPPAPASEHDRGVAPPIDVRFEDDDAPALGAKAVVVTPDGDRVLEGSGEDSAFLGFVAGRHYPPRDEPLDPTLRAAANSAPQDSRPDSCVYGFVMFGKRITPARLDALRAVGCRVLGFHPQNAVRVAAPRAGLEKLAALDFVRWVGAPRAWQKIDPQLQRALDGAPSTELLTVYINVFESDLGEASTLERLGSAAATGGVNAPLDSSAVGGEVWQSNGWQQRALQELGVEIVEYLDTIRAFRARVRPAQVEPLTDRDFVQFVEFQPQPTLLHDQSQPAVLSDLVRQTYDGDFSGAAAVGQIDSGFNAYHEMLDHAQAVSWELTPDGSPWLDSCNHGSHVGGTILGAPADARLRGTVPSVASSVNRRFRSAKWFYAIPTYPYCVTGSSLATALSTMRGTWVDNSGNATPEPRVINNSWGASPGFVNGQWTAHVGTDGNSRMIDDEVWNLRQLYVFAAGNDGSLPGSIGAPGVAKNAFTVGASIDHQSGSDAPGALVDFSSRGPCGDGRWKPNITAPGHWVTSADAAGGMATLHGTSMASPHVAGAAAALVDHFSWLANAPSRVASILMATALQHLDAVLVNHSDPHFDQFGAGKLNAGAAHYPIGNSSWSNWEVGLSPSQGTFADFTVAAGTTRLVVCMTYHEEQASSGASRALINDLDLWIDSPSGGLNTTTNSGEYTAGLSAVDNTEIRVLTNPQPGTWRWKMHPYDSPGVIRGSVTIYASINSSTPTLTANVTTSDTTIRPNDVATISASVTSDSFFASHAQLELITSGDQLQSASSTMLDGVVANQLGNDHAGRKMLLGTLPIGFTRSGAWSTRWPTQGAYFVQVRASAENASDGSEVRLFLVDGTAPGTLSNLISTSHTTGLWTNNSSVAFSWTAASDNLAGIDGYALAFASSPQLPSPSKALEEVTGYTHPASTGSWYLSLRALDNSGNWSGTYASAGPFRIDTVAPLGASNPSCFTHTVGVMSCVTSVSMDWTAAADAHSGLTGYLATWDTSPSTVPAGATNLAATTSGWTANIGSSSAARYFHLRPKDQAGNWGPTLHFGPIYANASSVSTYCTGKTNSLGCVPAISSINQPDKSAGNFTVRCSNVINNKIGYLFWGHASASTPFQGGIKCVAVPTVRTPNQLSGGAANGNSCTGAYSFVFTTAYMNSYGLDPGETVYAQWWTRDPSSPSTTGLSNALTFTVCQ